MTTKQPENFHREVLKTFQGRAMQQGWKKGTKTYAKHQFEFFVGADAGARALGFESNTLFLMLLSVGRDADDLLNAQSKPETKKE